MVNKFGETHITCQCKLSCSGTRQGYTLSYSGFFHWAGKLACENPHNLSFCRLKLLWMDLWYTLGYLSNF